MTYNVIITEESEIYEIMRIDQQYYFKNIAHIDFSECIGSNVYNFFVFKIEHFLP